MNTKCITHNSKLIIGLSGGPDSVYLLHKLIELRKEKNLTLIAAHLDHEWRKDSHKDTLFCKQLCTDLNVTFVSQKTSELDIAVKHNGSKEEVGRIVRRHFFEQLAQEYNADAIVLGHHADDQIETFFIRLMRGTTTYGLSGIKEKNGLYIRPLLQTTKKEILDYLNHNNLAYVVDATNSSDAYLRNRIRKNIIPACKTSDTRFEHNFARTLTHIQSAEQFLQKHTHAVYMQLLDDNNKIDVKKLLTLDEYLQKRVLQHWLAQERVQHTLTESFLDEMLRFLKSPRGGSHQLGAYVLIKKQSKAFFAN